MEPYRKLALLTEAAPALDRQVSLRLAQRPENTA